MLHHEYKDIYEKILENRGNENKDTEVVRKTSAKKSGDNVIPVESAGKPKKPQPEYKNVEKSDDSECSENEERMEVIRQVNEQRTKMGLGELAMDQKLQRAAQIRAKEQLKLFSHTRPDGTGCFTVLKEVKYSYSYVGENIAMGQTNAADVMNSWMNSKGHRENILNSNYTKIGVGEHKDAEGKKYWTQMFAKDK